MDPLQLASQLGTLNAPDRSKQYRRSDNDELLRSLNELWKAKRLLEVALADRDKQIGELHSRVEQRDKLIKEQAIYIRGYKIANIALTSVITGLAWEGLKFLFPIALRYLGIH